MLIGFLASLSQLWTKNEHNQKLYIVKECRLGNRLKEKNIKIEYKLFIPTSYIQNLN